jgi:hypothetical protein
MKSQGAIENPDTTKDVSIPAKKVKPAKRVQFADANELKTYFKALQAKHKVVHTTRLPSGQIVDWI